MTTTLQCSKDEMMNIAEHQFNVEGRCCSESVLLAACEALGVKNNDLIPSIVLGFGGGMGLQGHVCGAFSAAILGIGIATGRTIDDYAERKGETFQTVAAFLKKCVEKWKFIDCKSICGLDLTTPEGLERLMNGGVKDRICAPLVKEAAGMLQEELQRIINSRSRS
jgi:C_GCAxxG_C_C family probable redox protein